MMFHLPHVNGIHNLYLASFCQVKGDGVDMLAQLNNTRDRRLVVSKLCLMFDVCNRTPNILADTNIESFVYHRGRYQNFTKNPNRLDRGV